MSVGFDVSANTQSAQNALKQLREAFKDLQREGQKFAEIDLSGQLDPLKRDLKTLLDNWKAMTDLRLGGQFADRLRRSGQQGRAPWDVDLRAAHPHASAAELQRLQQRLVENLLRGLSGAHPDLPRPSPPPPATDPLRQQRDADRARRQQQADQDRQERDAERRRRQEQRAQEEEERDAQRRRQLITGGLVGGMKFTAGLAGVQTGLEAVQAAYQGAYDLNRSTDEFMRRTRDVGHDFEILRGQLGAVGRGLGVTTDEAAKLTVAFARTAHVATVEEATTGTQAALGLAAGFGANSEQTVQQMARLRLLGADGLPGGRGDLLTANQKRFALLIGQTVGQHNVPLEQGLADFSRLAEASSQRTLNAPPAETLAGLMQAMYHTAETRPGLKAFGGALLAQADEGLRNADDPASNLIMFQGLSKLMGTQNFLQILKQKQRGGLAPVPGTDQTNLSVFLTGLQRNVGGLDPLATAAYADQMLGLGGIERAEALIDIEKRYRTLGRNGLGGYQADLTRYGVDINRLDESGIKDLGDLLNPTDPAARLEAAQKKWDAGFDAAKPLSDEERNRLTALRADPAKSEEFVSALVNAIATHGRQQTPFSTMETTLAQIKDTLIQDVGQPIVGGLAEVAGLLQRSLGLTPEQAEAQERYDKAQANLKTFIPAKTDELHKARADMEAARGTPEFAGKVHAYQTALEAARADYQKQSTQRQEAYRQSGNLRFFPDRRQDEALFVSEYDNPNAGSPLSQQEIEIRRLRHERAELRHPSSWLKAPADPETATRREAEIDRLIQELETSPVKKAAGGLIPGGVGGGDRIHLAATPGEFVVRAGAAQKHLPLLEHLNSGGDPASDTTDAVRDLQKRLEELFDPVTRALVELVASTRAQAARTGNSAGPDGAAGEPASPGTTGGGLDLSRGSGGASIRHPLMGTFPGDGLGFMSRGAGPFGAGHEGDASDGASGASGGRAKHLPHQRASAAHAAVIDNTGVGGSGPTPKSQWAKKGAELARYYKKRLGLTDFQAAALAGNAIHESSLNTRASGDHGTAHGLFQWRKDRWQALQDYAKKTGRSPDDFNVQKEFAAMELESTESKALKKLKQTGNAADASRSINQYYERSADTLGSDMDLNRIRQTRAVMGEMGEDYTPKPDTEIPSPAREADTDAGRGIGHLDITLRQQDANGIPQGPDVNHRMNLRTSRPHGAVSVTAVNSQTV